MNRLIYEENSRSTDHCFANIYMWDDTYIQQVAEVEGCLCVRLDYEESPFYSCPIGAGDKPAAVRQLKEDAKQLGVPLRIRGICQRDLAWLGKAFPDEFTVQEDRFVFDYLYRTEKLATLSGKKLQQKRNHIHRFEDACPDWRFQPMTAADIPACQDFQRQWLAQHTAQGSADDYASEELALGRCFAHWTELEMEGGMLFSGDQMIGYTVGEKLNSDTFDVHFEKAVADIQGAYAMINREFVRYIAEQHPEIQYINREDDMGHENLRHAKMSYAPEALVEKYTADWRQV